MSNHLKGIPTLLATYTPSSVSDVQVSTNIDSTYDEYMFVFTDMQPSVNGANFIMQMDASGQTGFNEQIVGSSIRARLFEGNSGGEVTYQTSYDIVGTGNIYLTGEIGGGADECMAGFIHYYHLPSSTAVVQYTSRFSIYGYSDSSEEWVSGGYTSATNAAITKLYFAFSSGNMTGTIQHFGIE